MTDVRDLHQAWMADPEYQAAYEASEAEFAVAATMIAARKRAKLSQKDLAARMGTTQSAIARMESGKPVMSETIARYAAATGHVARLVMEPIKVPRRPARAAAAE